MTIPQTSVADAMTEGFAGLQADSNHNNDVRSYVNENADEIAFGLMVKQGTNDGQAALLDAVADIAQMIGVLVHSHAYDKDNELGDDGLKQYVTMGVLQKGTIWVPVEEAVTPADDCFIRCVAAGAEQAGAFRTDADGVDAVDCSAFCRFLTTTTGAGVAQIQFDVTMRGA